MIRENCSIVDADVQTEVVQTVVQQTFFAEIIECDHAITQCDDRDATREHLTKCFYYRAGSLSAPVQIENVTDGIDVDFEYAFVCDTIEEALTVMRNMLESMF